ncbi:MAG: DUF108 domain-containing protein [Endomicrobia bacterium]|nr:DUF108 domain-containing protein [Endomicrobiia bacterium]
MRKVGFIGVGNIASIVLITTNIRAKDIFFYDINSDNIRKLISKIRKKYRNTKINICSSLKEIIEFSDIIVEAASIEAAENILDVLNSNNNFIRKEFIILSVGAILSRFSLYKKIIDKGYKIHIPSGAIAGCDALSALKYSRIYKINLTTTKPSKTLINNEYIVKNSSLLRKILKKRRCIIYKGDVYNAIKFFPQNINVAATLAVVSEVPNKIKVKIVSDKSIRKNIHEVEIVSDAGKIYTKVENVPSPRNPKTSYLAALSTISILKKFL